MVAPERKRVAPAPRAPPPPRGQAQSRQQSANNDDFDLSKIPPRYQNVANVWLNLLQSTLPQLNPRMKRLITNNMNKLFEKLANQEFDDTVSGSLVQLTEFVSQKNTADALAIVMELSNTTWNENGEWLSGAKSLIQNIR